MKVAKGFKQNTFTSPAVSKSTPHPDTCTAAEPNDPANAH